MPCMQGTSMQNAARWPACHLSVVRIAWSTGDFDYVDGQYVFICVPAISLWEWRPFSLSSHPMADKVTVHIRVLGDCTKKLYNLASQ